MSELEFMSCIRFSLQLMMAGTVMTFYLPRRNCFFLRLAAGAAGYFVVMFFAFRAIQTAFGTMLIGQVVYYLCVFVVLLIFTALCFDIGEKELLFAGTGAYAIQHFAFSLAGMFDYLIGEWEDYYTWYRWILYLAVPVIVYWTAIRDYRKKGELKERDIRMVLLAFVTIFITIVVSLLAREGGGGGAPWLRQFVCNIYAALCCMLTLFILFYIPKENRLYHEYQTLEQVIRVMGEQQQITKESVEIINRKCHDIKHQIKGLMQMEDTEEKKRYLEKIRQAISIYDAVYQTGNSALDFILREKGLRCQEYEIKFSCLTDGKALSFMENLDIYALFGNLLDNAIESVVKEEDVEKRLINLHVLKRAQTLHIHVDNYCNEEIRFEDGLPLTDKKDKACHGFGVRSIRHIAEKYKGELVVKKEKDRFVSDILIPVPDEAVRG